MVSILAFTGNSITKSGKSLLKVWWGGFLDFPCEGVREYRPVLGPFILRGDL